MKGQIFSGQLNLSVEIKGESWFQGQPVEGKFTIKNQGTESISLKNMGVALALGELKKVHTNSSGALKKVASLFFTEKEQLPPNSEASLSFNFSLDTNAHITDKRKSFYICYGEDFGDSHLQLIVSPQPLFKQISEYLESFFRFKLKEIKGDKKGVLFVYKPPSSREMYNVESLELMLALEGEDLLIDSTFQVKKLDIDLKLSKILKEKSQYSSRLSPTEYTFGKGMINQEKVLAVIGEMINTMKLKVFK